MNPNVTQLSPPSRVSMGEDWYELAVKDHFWMTRRFAVLRRLFQPNTSDRCVDIGCGQGVVQEQLAKTFGCTVDGIDLNESALEHNKAEFGKLYCYNVFDLAPQLESVYDHAMLLDVIEHLDDDQAFLEASLHVVKPGGTIVINVPAFMHLSSPYDDAVGHVRRYNISQIQRFAKNLNLEIQNWTYWGLPLTPLLFARKAYLKVRRPKNIIQQGFDSRSATLNAMLKTLARFEWIPQHFYGTSLMIVLNRPSGD